AVDDPRVVAGRDAAVLAEGGRQLRQALHRRFGPHVIVPGEQLDALARLQLHRDDLVGEAPVGPGLLGELLTPDRVAILLVARDAVLGRTVLRRPRHRAAAVRVEERGVERVLELPLAEAEAAAQSADDVRRLAHVLHAAGQDDVRFAEQDELRAADRRLDAGSAQAVDR